MPLSVATSPGPHETFAAIGAGGIGELSRARDTKLSRDVALKILPEVFAHDADRMERLRAAAAGAEVLARVMVRATVTNLFVLHDSAPMPIVLFPLPGCGVPGALGTVW
jgi:hypothetical protein